MPFNRASPLPKGMKEADGTWTFGIFDSVVIIETAVTR
jgi:hypothetical protein